MDISDNPNYDASGTNVAGIIHVQGTGISDKWRDQQYFHWPNPGSQSAYRTTGSSSSKTNAHVFCYVNKWKKAAFYKDFIYKYTAV